MQPAPVSLPSEPINGVTCGIDSARDDHAVSVVDRSGNEIQRWTVVHSEAGLRGLVRRLGRVGVAEVTIERPDGPVVEALLGAGLTVVVISPNQLKNLRSRSAGAYCASIIPTASLRYGKRRKFTMKPATADHGVLAGAHADVVPRLATSSDVRWGSTRCVR